MHTSHQFILKNGANRNDACEFLQAATDYEVHCFDPSEHDTVDIIFHQSTNNSNNTNGTVYDENYVTRYQTSIWVPIVLGLSLIAIVYAMGTMDIKSDSVVYRNTNFKPHKQ